MWIRYNDRRLFLPKNIVLEGDFLLLLLLPIFIANRSTYVATLYS